MTTIAFVSVLVVAGCTDGAPVLFRVDRSDASTSLDASEERGIVCGGIDFVFALEVSPGMASARAALVETVFPRLAQGLVADTTPGSETRFAVLRGCPTGSVFQATSGDDDCDFSSGSTWIDLGSPDVVTEFACGEDIDLSNGGCVGSAEDDRTVQTAIAAFDPDGPNATSGFARPDALLVVFVLTDQDEAGPSAADNSPLPIQAAVLYDELLALRQQDTRRVVFFPAAPEQSCTGPHGPGVASPLLRAVADRFERSGRGRFFDLCNGLDASVAETMLTVLENACAEFPNP